jgi:hypothetical protein
LFLGRLFPLVDAESRELDDSLLHHLCRPIRREFQVAKWRIAPIDKKDSVPNQQHRDGDGARCEAANWTLERMSGISESAAMRPGRKLFGSVTSKCDYPTLLIKGLDRGRQAL